MTRSPEMVFLAALHALAVCLLLVSLLARARSRAVTLIGLAVVVLAGWAIFTRLVPARIPIGWITMLHEGNSDRVIRNAVGLGAHAGSGYVAVEQVLAGGHSLDIRDVVRANLWLASIATVLLFGIARERAKSLLVAAVAAGLFALNPLSIQAMLSELPSQLLAVQLLGATAAAALAVEASPEHRRLRLTAFATFIVWGVLAATTRIEMLAIFLPVTGALAVHVFGGPALVERIDDALTRAARRVLAPSRWRIVVLVLLLLAIPAADLVWGPGLAIAWANPIDLRALGLPLSLAECLPWGVIALVLLGWLHLLRRPIRWLLIPWALLGLARVYGKASHGSGFEMLRYASMLLAPLILLGVEGRNALIALAARRQWGDGWRAVAVVVFAASWLLPPGIGTSRAWPGSWPSTRRVADHLLVGRSTQVELRWLLARVDAEPQCVFVSRVAGPGGRYDMQHPGWSWLVFGRAQPVVEAPFSRPLREVVREVAPGAACVRFYRSADCALEGADDCRAELRGATPVAETEFSTPPYSDPGEYGPFPPSFKLGVYALP